MPLPLALLLLTAQVAPKPDVVALLAKMRRAYSTVKSAHISVKTNHYGHEARITSSSECDYKAPSSFHIATRGIAGLTKDAYELTTDGKQIHIEGLPGKPITMPYTVQAMVNNDPQLNLDVLCLWDWKRQLSTDPMGNMHFSTLVIKSDDWDGKKWIVLEETARRQNNIIDYYVDPKTFLICRTISSLLSPHRALSDVQVEKWDTTAKIDPTLFKIAAK
jgi:hypothetical protein